MPGRARPHRPVPDLWSADRFHTAARWPNLPASFAALGVGARGRRISRPEPRQPAAPQSRSCWNLFCRYHPYCPYHRLRQLRQPVRARPPARARQPPQVDRRRPGQRPKSTGSSSGGGSCEFSSGCGSGAAGRNPGQRTRPEMRGPRHATEWCTFGAPASVRWRTLSALGAAVAPRKDRVRFFGMGGRHHNRRAMRNGGGIGRGTGAGSGVDRGRP